MDTTFSSGKLISGKNSEINVKKNSETYFIPEVTFIAKLNYEENKEATPFSHFKALYILDVLKLAIIL